MTDSTTRTQLLDVVEAHEDRFLGLWVLDCLIEERHFFEKLAGDLQGNGANPSSGHDGWSINL
jgi:hypothetical protein